MSTVRFIPPQYVICADLVTCLGYSSTGVSMAFRQYPSYMIATIPAHKKGVAVVDLSDAKDWLEKKSKNNSMASTVLTLLSKVDFSQGVTSYESDDLKITLLDETCEKQVVSNDRSFAEAMAEIKEIRRQSDLYVAELNKRRILYGECRREILAAQAEIASYLEEIELSQN